MKIFANDKVYVQLKDLSLLFNVGGYSIPQSIYKIALSKSLNMTEETKNSFIEFDDPKDIEFIRSVDYIIDFDEYKDMTNKEYQNFVLSASRRIENNNEKYDATNKYFDRLGLRKNNKIECHKVIGVRESRLAYKGKNEYDMPVPVKKKSLFNIFQRRNG
jgi:hypothetical protein